MKKLTLGTALASLLALTACGETDTREKHRYTVEVEVTEPSGKVQKISKECNQMPDRCRAVFDLETPLGKRTIHVISRNDPVHHQEIYKKVRSANSEEEANRLTDSEYDQVVMINGFGFNKSLQKTWFKDVDYQPTKWTPRTERIIEQELMIPNPDLVKRIEDLQMQIKEVRSKRSMNRKERDDQHEKVRELEAEIRSISVSDVKAADLKIRIY